MDDPVRAPRPLERRTSVRTAVVWETLQEVLAAGSDATVVDVGGGTGGFAVRLAGLGHRVTVVDPSPDALAILARRAEEDAVADRVAGIQGDLGSLLDLPGLPGEADLVLCHGVLGILDDPGGALADVARLLRPGGTLSLLVAQRHAAVLARAMAGHFRAAGAVLDGAPEPGERRFTADEVADLVTTAGLTCEAMHGIRVFSDLVPGSLLDLEPGAGASLLDLERAVAARPEYLTLASQLHALGRR